MCGINGIFLHQPFSSREYAEELIQGMNRILAHRGPDAANYYVDDKFPVALGHQRLSVIDISQGDQPMTNATNSLWLVFNGEIYNFCELRTELKSAGYTFKSKSDTEVILHAYDYWGDDCVRHLRGMFAFCIWDRNRQRFFCARDHLGIKPFYYQWDGKSLVFASELKAIAYNPICNVTLDKSSVVDYLYFGYVPAPNTAFEQIKKLPAGCTMVLESGRLQVSRYWQVGSKDSMASFTESMWIEKLREELEKVVSMQLVSDVPLGAFLSGGTDSSAVVALMSRTGKGVNTHCLSFGNSTVDEARYANSIAKLLETDHKETVLPDQWENSLDKIIWHLDEPIADASAIPTYFLCQAARKNLTVCLSGDGGDEVFAGYNWYNELRKLECVDGYVPSGMRKISASFGRFLPETIRGGTLLQNIGLDPALRHKNLMMLFGPEAVDRLYPKLKLVGKHADPIGELYELVVNSGLDSIGKAQWVDSQSYLAEDILMKVDKMSMAHGLEVRVPLLDHKIVELVFSMPTSLKLEEGRHKYVLKKSVEDLINPRLFDRKKQGFSAPIKDWLVGPLNERVGDYLLSNNSSNSGCFDTKEVSVLWNKLKNSRTSIDLSGHVWALLNFEIWYEQFVKNKHASAGHKKFN